MEDKQLGTAKFVADVIALTAPLAIFGDHIETVQTLVGQKSLTIFSATPPMGSPGTITKHEVPEWASPLEMWPDLIIGDQD